MAIIGNNFQTGKGNISLITIITSVDSVLIVLDAVILFQQKTKILFPLPPLALAGLLAAELADK